VEERLLRKPECGPTEELLELNMKELLIGEWQAELIGVDLLYLEPAAGKFDMRLTLHADGTASCCAGLLESSVEMQPPIPLFPTTWDLSSEQVLSIWEPVPPMPKYGMPDWSRNQIRYDVLSVTDLSLTISDRRFDGEHVIVFRRVDLAAYTQR
jgi:hypothetical protein